MAYDAINCPQCPYYWQRHLVGTQRTGRPFPPVELEDKDRDVLLVFQAPGIEEWRAGAPIQPTTRQGGTAGARIAQSWERTGRDRSEFDIINVVQCFPGSERGKRDFAPHSLAVCACKSRLDAVLAGKRYSKVIAFGEIACEVVAHLAISGNYGFRLLFSGHPTGGLEQKVLDSLW